MTVPSLDDATKTTDPEAGGTASATNAVKAICGSADVGTVDEEEGVDPISCENPSTWLGRIVTNAGTWEKLESGRLSGLTVSGGMSAGNSMSATWIDDDESTICWIDPIEYERRGSAMFELIRRSSMPNAADALSKRRSKPSSCRILESGSHMSCKCSCGWQTEAAIAVLCATRQT